MLTDKIIKLNKTNYAVNCTFINNQTQKHYKYALIIDASNEKVYNFKYHNYKNTYLCLKQRYNNSVYIFDDNVFNECVKNIEINDDDIKQYVDEKFIEIVNKLVRDTENCFRFDFYYFEQRCNNSLKLLGGNIVKSDKNYKIINDDGQYYIQVFKNNIISYINKIESINDELISEILKKYL